MFKGAFSSLELDRQKPKDMISHNEWLISAMFIKKIYIHIMYTTMQKLKKIYIFTKDPLNWSKLTVNTCNVHLYTCNVKKIV